MDTLTQTELLRDLDFVIAKALKVREVAQVARIETTLRQFITREWEGLKRQALRDARRVLLQGAGELDRGEVDDVARAVDRIMRRWSRRVTARFLEDMEEIYRLSREAAWRKGLGRTSGSLQYDTPPFVATPQAIEDRQDKEDREARRARAAVKAEPTLLPSFDLEDEAAIQALRRNQTFWIGQHYSRNISRHVRDTIRDTMLVDGIGRAEAGRLLSQSLRAALSRVQTPTGWVGTDKQYFEGLAANGASVARGHGHLRSFKTLGFTHYEISTAGDERTCPVCGHMDGKVFTLKQGLQQVEDEVKAKKPEDVKEVHPWLSPKELFAVSPKPGNSGGRDAQALARAGFSIPPFHFRCRCTVDIHESD